ncbi:MAG: hypothetical protein Q8P56_06200 [Candidatus Uhrbacteria bacterium]|nr:hypothetical protein [Candidatus Uhrbacteria bacterium]
MISDIKNCQNCKKDFTVEPEDFLFYEKIHVPPPTWCPPCRLQRRMLFTNERALYRSTCGLCLKDIITMYHPDSEFPVYCKQCWWSDNWNEMSYGMDVDFTRPFLQQVAELKKHVPRVNLVQEGSMEGSEYCNRATNNKNCYLCFRSTNNEDCLYSHPIVDSRDCVDCFSVSQCERAYECSDCIKCYNTQYCQESQNCTDSAFLYDCRNCSNCFGCINLRSKEYYIFNTPHTKEEYIRKMKELSLKSYTRLCEVNKKFSGFTAVCVRPSITATHSEDVSGNWLQDCKNVKESFMCRNAENGKYLYFIIDGKDCMDYFHFGRGCELVYETSNCGLNCSRMYFDNETFMDCSDLQYCDGCFSSFDCFGCVGLRRGRKRCILNKEYPADEYVALVERIKKHMDDMPYVDVQGRRFGYGEFFPPEFSPVAYNESVAQEFFPLTKESALATGYTWRDREEKSLNITMPYDHIPDTIDEVNDDILGHIIGCMHGGTCTEQCTRGFKLTKQELAFYKTVGLPIPRLCPNCRHTQRFGSRPSSVIMYDRRCQCAGTSSQNGVYNNSVGHSHGTAPCSATFKTSYAPERVDIIYCAECYQQEIL